MKLLVENIYFFTFQKIEKTDNTINLSKTYVKTNVNLQPEASQQTIKLNKLSHSILKQFEQ